MRVGIIGAGSSGLVLAKILKEQKDKYSCIDIYEKDTNIGGVFVNKVYEDGSLVSSKYLTAFSDFRFRKDDDDHPSMERYAEYLEEYTAKFQLKSLILFDHKVTGLKKVGERYEIRCTKGASDGKSTEEVVAYYDAVSVCSGLHNFPDIPDIPGLKTFPGLCIHSAEYKKKQIFKDKRVLVVGSGETGMDIAYQSVQVADKTYMHIRRGFLSVPNQLSKTVPLDTFNTNLFECAYVHPWVEALHLKWKFTTIVIRLFFLFLSGSSWGFNQWVGRVKHVKRGYNIICKSTKAIKHLNVTAKKNSWFGWLYRWLDDHVDKPIYPIVGTEISHIDKSTVVFKNGDKIECDVIVLGTGYKQEFPFLTQSSSKKSGGILPSERLIINQDGPRLSFLGFVRPNVGAIPPMAELQAMWWVQVLNKKIKFPLTPPTYPLLGQHHRTGEYGVDYGSYMHDLGRDMGVAPDIFQLIWKPKICIAYVIGQAYVGFFRLRGPFYSKEVERIMETECYYPVQTRGWVSNLIFATMVWLFGAVNLTAFLVDKLCFSWWRKK